MFIGQYINTDMVECAFAYDFDHCNKDYVLESSVCEGSDCEPSLLQLDSYIVIM